MFIRSRWLIVGLLGLMLIPVRAHAAPQTATIDGVITAVDASRKPVLVTIESAEERVTLKVTTATNIGPLGPPPPPGVTAAAISGIETLQFGYEARATYVVSTHVAKSISVSTTQVLARGSGKVVSVGSVPDLLFVDTTADGASDLSLLVGAETALALGPASISQDQLSLLAGQTVEFDYEIATGHAEKVTAVLGSVSTVEGEVTSVDAPSRVLTLQTLGGAVTFTVAAGADLRVLGRRVSLDTLLVGDTVRVTFAALASGPKVVVAGAITGVKLKVVQGLLSSVDASGGTFIVKVGRGTLTLRVTSDTLLKLNGRAATLSDLASALATGRPVLTAAEYLTRRTENVATQVKAAGQTSQR